jgi:hypothetical protein
MAQVGEVAGEPYPVTVAVGEREPVVSVWLGLDGTDLTPAAARQLAAFLRTAASRAERR